MLNGIDPIIIFSFFKNLSAAETEALKDFPVAKFTAQFAFPPIPIYLNEKTTGVFIDEESKNIDIDTEANTLASGDDPEFAQKAIGSVTKVTMKANKDSIGLTILMALMDLILPKVTSKEYSISYLHGSTIIFGGLLHSFSQEQEAGSDLIKITMEIVKKPKKTSAVDVKNPDTNTPLQNVGSVPDSGKLGVVSSAPAGSAGAAVDIKGVP